MINQNIQFPSTRYSGSKRRFLEWIWENIKEIKFESALDVFGGTGSVSLLLKIHGKTVYYNDLLKFNQLIGIALISNKGIMVTEDDLQEALNFNGSKYPDLIQREFKGIFYLDHENAWLDKAGTKFSAIEDPYKKAILLSALFQACLAKRPFNLFHRANLNIRTKKVYRSFGNKTTWEHSFDCLVTRYVYEYNNAVFDNGRRNKMIGGFDALSCPNSVDLVYLDPPYFSASSTQGTNYLSFYHFLEGLACYDSWQDKINSSKNKIKKFNDPIEISRWVNKTEIYATFRKLISRFQDNIIVLSYQSEGLPSKEEIISMFEEFNKRVKVFSRPHRYALSSRTKEELLFIAK